MESRRRGPMRAAGGTMRGGEMINILDFLRVRGAAEEMINILDFLRLHQSVVSRTDLHRSGPNSPDLN
eukprot:3180581-Pleurochrysis_carterae.AAC.1